MKPTRDMILKLAKEAGFSTQLNHIEYTEYEENLWGGRSQTDNLIRYTELLSRNNLSDLDLEIIKDCIRDSIAMDNNSPSITPDIRYRIDRKSEVLKRVKESLYSEVEN